MSPVAIGAAVFACTFGGALFGMKLRFLLPASHLNDASKDTVRIGFALIATMTALVLGLVTASAQDSFRAANKAVREAADTVLSLDRVLARYGQETEGIRADLKSLIEKRVGMAWPRDGTGRLDPAYHIHQSESLVARMSGLSPQTDEQRWLRTRALNLGETLLDVRWQVVAGIRTPISTAFLVILIFWLTATFASFGLFAPRNATVLAILFVCALSVAGAVFLVSEMNQPFRGFVKISPAPFEYALDQLNR